MIHAGLSQLTFDPSVFDAGSHSEEHFSQFVVASGAGEREKTFTIFTGILDSLTCWSGRLLYMMILFTKQNEHRV